MLAAGRLGTLGIATGMAARFFLLWCLAAAFDDDSSLELSVSLSEDSAAETVGDRLVHKEERHGEESDEGHFSKIVVQAHNKS